MNSLHMMWWVIKYLRDKHPQILNEMKREMEGTTAGAPAPWVNPTFNEMVSSFDEKAIR